MHGCLREPFIGSKNDLILKRLGMSALTQIIDDFNHDQINSNETTNEGWRPPR